MGALTITEYPPAYQATPNDRDVFPSLAIMPTEDERRFLVMKTNQVLDKFHDLLVISHPTPEASTAIEVIVRRGCLLAGSLVMIAPRSINFMGGWRESEQGHELRQAVRECVVLSARGSEVSVAHMAVETIKELMNHAVRKLEEHKDARSAYKRLGERLDKEVNRVKGRIRKANKIVDRLHQRRL